MHEVKRLQAWLLMCFCGFFQKYLNRHGKKRNLLGICVGEFENESKLLTDLFLSKKWQKLTVIFIYYLIYDYFYEKFFMFLIIYTYIFWIIFGHNFCIYTILLFHFLHRFIQLRLFYFAKINHCNRINVTSSLVPAP